MGINELAIWKKGELSTDIQTERLFKEVPVVNYALVDSTKYSFEYKVNDDIDVNMYESDRSYDGDEFIDADFDDAVSEKDYSYYAVAVASGILTGGLSQLKPSEEVLSKIKEWKSKDWDQYIVLAARLAGYNKSDLKGAIAFIKDRFVPYVQDNLSQEVQDGIDEWLKLLSCHPTLAGLAFSLFTQFSEERYSFGEKGLNRETIPDYYAIGRNYVEKIVYGFLYWLFNLSIDVAISKRTLLEDIKIPSQILILLKELYKLPIFRNLPHDYVEAEECFSKWITKIFENSQFTDDEGHQKAFDLRDEIDALGSRLFEINTPVIINECIVRTFYLVKKLIIEIKDKDVKCIDDLEKIDLEKIIPFNNRLISRMVLISSGCFMGINVAGATVKATIGDKKRDEKFSAVLLAEINFAGVGRFVFACVADSKYWSDDIKVFLQRKDKNKAVDSSNGEEKVVEDMMSNDSFKVLSLTPEQARVLYSLESIAISKDIEHTKDVKDKARKLKWQNLWQMRILEGMEIDDVSYFVTDEKGIYDVFYKMEQSEDNLKSFYLMSMELIVFKPYYPLGSEYDSEFKKLKRDKYNYIDDQFARRQTIVSQGEIDSIREAYIKYKGIVSGSTQNKIIAAGVAAVAAVASGGLAFAFAPGIATLIAGEAVVGLHGAALTSASLAFVGFGSVASGGLGMAGGTAIITGGGALLGIAGSGSASMAAILSQTSIDYWIRQTAKLLTFNKCVLKDRFDDVISIQSLSTEITHTLDNVEENLKELEAEKCSLDKEVIKNTKECMKYLNRCKNELDKLV